MITHCPSCHTHFRVRAEQLAVRAGQVRCGRCSQVFDAFEYLAAETVPASATQAALGPGPDATGAGVGAEKAAPEPDFAQAADIAATAPANANAAAAAIAAETDEAAVEAPQAAPVLAPLEAEPAEVEIEMTPGASAFDFGPKAHAEVAGRGRRWPWLLGALLLLLLLLAQAAYHYRIAVTLLFPEIRPYIVALCASLRCDLPLPQRIDLLSIEGSDLQADATNPNVMVLSATIKNRAGFNQQHPLLELTLTDAQDQPVVRRVLEPQEYLGKAVNIQVGFAANTEMAIKVFIEGSQVKATGYRLYLFYP